MKVWGEGVQGFQGFRVSVDSLVQGDDFHRVGAGGRGREGIFILKVQGCGRSNQEGNKLLRWITSTKKEGPEGRKQ